MLADKPAETDTKSVADMSADKLVDTTPTSDMTSVDRMADKPGWTLPSTGAVPGRKRPGTTSLTDRKQLTAGKGIEVLMADRLTDDMMGLMGPGIELIVGICGVN
jgi:hypothetical protein